MISTSSISGGCSISGECSISGDCAACGERGACAEGTESRSETVVKAMDSGSWRSTSSDAALASDEPKSSSQASRSAVTAGVNCA
ncbi:Uncharacterised protein [Mycobacteroides abscessus subsp. abscessus]|nr:Uncharacterised protein [Mycobacteroides abscessus subsp. abscessus]